MASANPAMTHKLTGQCPPRGVQNTALNPHLLGKLNILLVSLSVEEALIAMRLWSTFLILLVVLCRTDPMVVALRPSSFHGCVALTCRGAICFPNSRWFVRVPTYHHHNSLSGLMLNQCASSSGCWNDLYLALIISICYVSVAILR
jgi:hypothetical protein